MGFVGAVRSFLAPVGFGSFLASALLLCQVPRFISFLCSTWNIFHIGFSRFHASRSYRLHLFSLLLLVYRLHVCHALFMVSIPIWQFVERSEVLPSLARRVYLRSERHRCCVSEAHIEHQPSARPPRWVLHVTGRRPRVCYSLARAEALLADLTD